MHNDPWVQAVAHELCDHQGVGKTCRFCYDDAAIAVAALVPLVEADLRERIAQKIEDGCEHHGVTGGWCPCCADAAAIARGQA